MQRQITLFIFTLCLSAMLQAVPPTAPTITISINEQQLDIDFTATAGLTYKLYYALYPQQLNPLNIQSISLETNHFHFSPLPDKEIFAAAVTAINAANEESALSNIVWISLNEVQAGSAAATSTDISVAAYQQVIPALSAEMTTQVEAGRQAFNQQYTEETGLGEDYNEASCASCHHHNGRGTPANATNKSSGLVFLIHSAINVDTLEPLPIPEFGLQLHDKTTKSSAPDVEISTQYTFTTETFADGVEYELRRPIYDVTPFINLPNTTLFSPRLAPPLYGIGLLALVPDQTILDLVTEQAQGQFDLNNDGIPNVDTDPDLITGKVNILGINTSEFGRFGLKAERRNISEQIRIDFAQSMGIDENEQNNEVINNITRYLQTLAVPQRRNINDPRVRKGQLTFALAKCATCHYPTLKTGQSTEFPSLSEQVIHPYTDLLLHDMGAGLADGKPSFSANTQEWRTPALWGIGLRSTVNSEASYLHDGRARTIMEAIMWHGGEATRVRETVRNLSQQERDDLVLFIQSL